MSSLVIGRGVGAGGGGPENENKQADHWFTFGDARRGWLLRGRENDGPISRAIIYPTFSFTPIVTPI
jgi:hypothetical protein